MLIEIPDATREKKRNEFRRIVAAFHQDDAQLHISTITRWTVYKLEWNLMQYTTYNHDMSLFDFYLFSHLYLHFDGTIFI